MRTPGASRALFLVGLVSGLWLLTQDEKLAQPTGEMNFVLGQKSLDPDDWEPAEKQNEFSVDATWGNEAWDILIATDLSYSRDEGDLFDPSLGFPVKFTASTSELSVGFRKIWEIKNIRPFLGGGFAWVKAKAEVEALGVTASEDDSGVGPWLGGGVFWRLGSRFNIGIDVRYSDANVTISGFNVEAGGFHGGLLLGWGWPAGK